MMQLHSAIRIPQSEIRNRRFSHLSRFGVAALAVAAVLSAALVWYAMHQADRQLRGALLQQARIVASAVNVERVAALSGTSADTASTDYLRLKNQLAGMRHADPACRFVYLMGEMPDGVIFFFVDSEPTGSVDESPPGQTYDEASPEVHAVFATRHETTAGPARDRWGTWVSAFVPMLDPVTGRLVAVAGIDVDARGWTARVIRSGAFSALFVLLAAGLALFVLRVQRANRGIREGQQTLQAIFRGAPAGIGIVMERTFVDVNDRLCDMIGMPRDELIGQSTRVIYPSQEEFERVGLEIYKSVAEHGSGTIETVFRREDGALLNVLLSSSALDRARPERGVAFAALDVTERTRAVEELRISEERFAKTFRSSPDAILLTTVPDGRIVEVNEGMMQMSGYAIEEALGRTTSELGLWAEPSDRDRYMALIRREGRAVNFETTFRTKSGEIIDGLISGEIVQLQDGSHFLSVVRDITELKRADAALRENEGRLRAAFEGLHDAVTILTADGQFVDCNQRALEMFRVDSKARFMERRPADFSPPVQPDGRESLVASREKLKEVLVHGGFVQFEWLHQRADGEVFPAEVVLSTYQQAGQTYIQGSVRDISERKRTEEALRVQTTYLQELFEGAPEAIVVLDNDDMVRGINREFTRLFEYELEEAIGRKINDLIVPEDLKTEGAQATADVAAGKRILFETVRQAKSGRRIPVSVLGNPIRLGTDQLGVYGIYRDITERKKAEGEREKLQGQLVQAQRMEAVGRLAGGVAHDFNNMLQVVLGHLEMALSGLSAEDPLREDLEEVRRAARRSADLTRQLLAFARKQIAQPKALDLNETIEGMLAMLGRLIGEDIRLSWKPKAGLWQVRIDPSQVDQVLANLCLNARDAIGGVGDVLIETDNVLIEEGCELSHGSVASGSYVMVSVRDDGCGMTDEVLGHLFEPFFTTKGVGEGTGLGLATVHGIVTQNEGAIDVETKEGRGTTIRIYLPRYQGQEAKTRSEAATETHRGSDETVLLVEDDEAILRMGVRMLEGLGYQVLSAGAPDEALKRAQQHEGKIDLLISDVVMPQMNGKELVGRLEALRPGVKCLYMSGYTADVVAQRGVVEDGMRFLQKPFTVQELAEKVREALEG